MYIIHLYYIFIHNECHDYINMYDYKNTVFFRLAHIPIVLYSKPYLVVLCISFHWSATLIEYNGSGKPYDRRGKSGMRITKL